MTRDQSATVTKPLTPALITALLGIALLLSVAGCDTADQNARLEEAHQTWLEYVAARPTPDTAAASEEHRQGMQAMARKTLGTVEPGLSGDAACRAGSLLVAAGDPAAGLPLLETGLSAASADLRDGTHMAAAAACLALDRPDQASNHLEAVTDRTAAPGDGMSGSYNELLFVLVEAYEEESRWADTLPLLELVRDSDDQRLAPVAARWIAYIHRDAGHEEQATAAARDAMARFPDDENLNTRMVNFIHQHGLVDQPLPELPRLTWIGTTTEGTSLAGLLEGQVGLIDLWAPWCPPCRKSFPFLRDLMERHGEKGLRVVGLTRLYGYYEDEKTRIDDTPPPRELELIGAFTASHQLDWPVGVAVEGETLFATLGVAGIPNFILVDRQGVVRGTFLGETAPVKRQIEELAIKLLQQN